MRGLEEDVWRDTYTCGLCDGFDGESLVVVDGHHDLSVVAAVVVVVVKVALPVWPDAGPGGGRYQALARVTGTRVASRC